MRHYRLITSPESIASAKLKLYLRWRNVPYREQPATRVVLKSEVVPRLRRIAIPVLVTPSNETLQDSRTVIDHLERREPGRGLYPERPADRFASRLLEMFADEWLAPTVSFAVWSGKDNSTALSLAEMLYPERPASDRTRIARMLDAQVRAKLGRQGLLQKTWPDRAAQLQKCVRLLDRQLGRNRFLLGAEPSVADCAVAAALASLWAETSIGADLLREARSVSAWLHAVNGGPIVSGLAPSENPDAAALNDLLRFAAEQTLPHALGACEAVSDWADSHPGKINLPRSVGTSSAKRDTTGVSRDFTPASAWMLQRLLETIEDKPGESLRDRLEASRCDMLLRYAPRREIRHEHHRFRVEIRETEEGEAVNVHALAEPLLKARQSSVETRDLERLVLG